MTLRRAARRVLDRAEGADAITDALAALSPRREQPEALIDRVLRAAQRRRGGRTFGRCARCRHLSGARGARRAAPGARRCGLTDEPLSARDTTLLCIEHEERAPAA
jgi:hypothetical protein